MHGSRTDENGKSAGRTEKIGEIHVMKQMSITELAEVYGRKPDTLQRKAKDLLPPPPGGKWSIHSVVTEEEARILLGDIPAKRPALSVDAAALQRDFDAVSGDLERAAKKVIEAQHNKISGDKATAIKAKATPSPRRWAMPSFHTVRRIAISALLFSVVVMHGLLIWYDCAVLWDVPGQIGGGTVFIVVLAALLLASDSTLPRTSGNALAFIFFVDCAAWKVHFEVFKTPVVDNIVTGSLCAFICAASFIALYLFRDSKLD